MFPYNIDGIFVVGLIEVVHKNLAFKKKASDNPFILI